MIIPAIDLIDGQVVRLYQGDYNQRTNFDLSAIAQLQAYAAQGAKLLHIVDLSGAKDPSQAQTGLLKQIAQQVPATIQVGGGLREKNQLETLFNAGVDRVVIGSLAVKEPKLVAQWLSEFGAEKICLALDMVIDSGEKRIALHGWQQYAEQSFDELCDFYLSAGLKHALVTDIHRDGTMQGSNTELYQSLAEQYPQIQWQASGGIANLTHVAAVKQAGASGIIIGKALLTEQFTVKEAIACWQNGSSLV